MITFYCSRRSRSSKLSFCSPQGAGQQLSELGFVFFLYERRGRSGPLQLKWFYWGQALGGHLNIVVWLFCAAERGACESFRMGYQLFGVVGNQTEIWAFLKLFKEAQLDCSKWCKRPL